MDYNLTGAIAANVTSIQPMLGSSENALNLSTLIGVFIGFILSQMAEYLRSRRESIAINKKLLLLLTQDWETNRTIIANNILLISKDNEAMAESRHLIAPLELLATGFWDIIKSNLPNKLIDGDTLVNIRNIAILTMRINEYVQSREAFRINNMGIMDTDPNRKIYNEMLLAEMNKLSKSLNTFLQIYTYNGLNRNFMSKVWKRYLIERDTSASRQQPVTATKAKGK